MEKLTDLYGAPMTFRLCQLCGHESSDICEFYLWIECDDEDKKTNKILVTCRRHICNEIIRTHPRLYINPPWGQGGPGVFMLLCGDCSYRNGSVCENPNLTANGGDGLEVFFGNPIGRAVICGDDGCRRGPLGPAVKCEGRAELKVLVEEK